MIVFTGIEKTGKNLYSRKCKVFLRVMKE